MHLRIVKWSALMLILKWCAPIFAASAFAATSLNWTEDLNVSLTWKAMRVPKWTHGAIIDVQYDSNTPQPLVWVVERQRTYTLPFTIPGAVSINVYDWDRTFDGKEMALSGSAMDTVGRSAYFIARISLDGTNSVITRDSIYMPRKIAFAPDGSLWTSGVERKGPGDAGVFRRYDRSGKILGAFVPKSMFPDILVLFDHTGCLMASNDRVAWYSSRGSRYIEMSLQGNLLTDIAIDPPSDPFNGYGMGLTYNGDVFISAAHSAVAAGGSRVTIWTIYILDRSTRTWRPVFERSTDGPDFGHIYGVDSNGSSDKLVIAGDKRVMFFEKTN
jgi:hypothetical protein